MYAFKVMQITYTRLKALYRTVERNALDRISY